MSDTELEAARREIARLRALAEANKQSALLHAERASTREQEVRTIRRSTAWRLTLPLRMAGIAAKHPRAMLRHARRLANVLATEGAGGAVSRVRQRMGPAQVSSAAAIYGQAQDVDPASLLAPRVLMIAELSIAQCTKYRVRQKQALLNLLGTQCTVLNWADHTACYSALQTHPVVIFYRVPMQPVTQDLFLEARRVGAVGYWEVDDLIFDAARYASNRNLDQLTPELRATLLRGVDEYRGGMLACERTIASTEVLAGYMREAGAGPPTVIENALDEETITFTSSVRAQPRTLCETVLIVYGSGTKTHDFDFTMAAPALAAVLQARPEAAIRLIGELDLPEVLHPFADRIERLPPTGYANYLRLMGEADVAIAPLENSEFNDAKSNIKFIEAAMLALPSVCSPRANFRSVISDGENGFLADDDQAWEAALRRLVERPDLRRQMGEAALSTVLGRYAPEAVARQQVAPIVAGLDRRRKPGLRVLVVNIFFAPTSFGGATIIAEEMAKRLHARDDTEVFILTSRRDESEPYTLRRYTVDGMPVFGVRLPKEDLIADFDNPQMGTLFADVLRGVQPDVVHFHSLQMLSVSLLRACTELGIPYVVTVHDAWWLCARQFMVRGDDTYCFQTRIDLNVCEPCLPGFSHLRQRMQIMMQALSGAALVISPSETHRQLYLANGFAPDRVLVNHNGIRMPARPRTPRRAAGVVRFGYVGGAYALKGFEVIRAAFARITASNYELVFVDSMLKLGRHSINTTGWQLTGKLRIVPPYSQDELDEFFDGMDVLLFPSQWKESFGLTACEALARDVWVIATAGAGAAEFIVDGENGTLIPLTTDPAPLQHAVEALLAHPERLEGHVNRYKSQLNTYDAQAEELYGYLRRVTRTEPADPLPPALPAY